tara:strand:- start:97 stop:483 length:387 start_codon:yes stop_codon:yes gene_type:complete
MVTDNEYSSVKLRPLKSSSIIFQNDSEVVLTFVLKTSLSLVLEFVATTLYVKDFGTIKLIVVLDFELAPCIIGMNVLSQLKAVFFVVFCLRVEQLNEIRTIANNKYFIRSPIQKNSPLVKEGQYSKDD